MTCGTSAQARIEHFHSDVHTSQQDNGASVIQSRPTVDKEAEIPCIPRHVIFLPSLTTRAHSADISGFACLVCRGRLRLTSQTMRASQASRVLADADSFGQLRAGALATGAANAPFASQQCVLHKTINLSQAAGLGT